jgi:FKBP-type peptidyl-prolyl cis-trans isomerase (trigger factor)
MVVKNKEMRLLRSSILWEVQESKHKDEVNSREQNIEKSVNISRFRKPVLSVADFKSFLLQEATWEKMGKSYT